MKNFSPTLFKRHYIIIVLFLLLPMAASAQDEVLSSSQWSAIDSYIKKEMDLRHIPGLTLGIYHKGHIVKSEAYGVADVQNSSPASSITIFELASISKQFTASAIMLLAQDGRLELEDKIHKYLPDAPECWDLIEIRHLLTHTSGLPGMYEGFSGFNSLNNQQLRHYARGYTTAAIAYEMARGDTLRFIPGEKYLYSDVGYFLLGLIIQEVSGMSYREFMQNRIFDPAGMKDTYILDQSTIHLNEARGYGMINGELVNIRRYRDFEVPSHYGIFSNIKDLASWDSILYTEVILTNETKKKMWAPTRLNNGNMYPYGFGWSTWTRNGVNVIDHTGITGTQITRMLDDSLTVVVLTNLGNMAGASVNSWGIGPDILQMMGYEPYINEKYITSSGASVVKSGVKKDRRIEGSYSDGNNLRRIYYENDQLFYDNGRTKNKLAILSDGSYLLLGTLEEWVLKTKVSHNTSTDSFQWFLNGEPSMILNRIPD